MKFKITTKRLLGKFEKDQVVEPEKGSELERLMKTLVLQEEAKEVIEEVKEEAKKETKKETKTVKK